MLLNCGTGEILRVPWTARRSNQSILKEINSEYPLKGLMLKLFQYFGHLMWITDSLEKTLMLGKIEGRRRRGQQRMASPTRWTWVWANSGSWWWTGKPGMLQSMGSQRFGHDWATDLKCDENERPGKSLCFKAFCLAALYNEDISHTLLLLLCHHECMLGLLWWKDETYGEWICHSWGHWDMFASSQLPPETWSQPLASWLKKTRKSGNSLVVQWLGLHASTTRNLVNHWLGN